MSKITLFTINDNALAFAARIYVTAAPEDREAIARYGGCLIVGAAPGAVTLANYAAALHNVWTLEYERFTEHLLENEILLLNDSIARTVAMLSNPRLGLR